MPGTMRVDRVFRNAHVATMAADRDGLGIVEDAVIAAREGRIAWVGARGEAPPFEADDVVDLGGRWVTPGLVDCHTHLVFAGDRSDEFERLRAGESYAEIARSGGGIAATVRATRAASEEALIEAALPRLDALIAEGVTTVEIKSGYGLDAQTEVRQLQVAQTLPSRRRIDVVTTYLGAHSLPKDMPRADYLDLICRQMIPRIAEDGLAHAVDAFAEGIAYSNDEVRRVFEAAQEVSLPVKLHADQLTNTGGAALAARYGALSADHLEYTDESGVAAMAAAGTVAVVLPGAYFMLSETQKPPIGAFRRHGVPMAVATDLNPGSSPIASLRLSATMACVLFGLTVEEALLGMTRHAALALGRSDIGVIAPGRHCDLAVWSVDRLAELVAKIGPAPLQMRVWRGA
jgi:imidazolonepropionase